MDEPFTHFRREVCKDEVNGKHPEIGLLEVGFACIEKHESFAIVPPGGTHELVRQVLKRDGDSLPTGLFEKVADFIFAGFSAPQGWLGDGEAVGPGQSDDPDVVAKQFVLEVQPPQIFQRKRTLQAE